MKVLVSLVSLIAFLLVILPGPLYKFGIVELELRLLVLNLVFTLVALHWCYL